MHQVLKFKSYTTFRGCQSSSARDNLTCGTVWLCHYLEQCCCVIIWHNVFVSLFGSVWLCQYLAQCGCVII